MVKKEFFRFIAVGILSTVVNYSIFFGLFELLKMHYLLASAIGFFSGVLIGYMLNKQWTFEVTEIQKTDIINYYGVYLTSLGLSLLFLELSIKTLGWNPFLANFFAIGLTTCTNFIGIKLWVFSNKK